jgi:hypothetical protein
MSSTMWVYTYTQQKPYTYLFICTKINKNYKLRTGEILERGRGKVDRLGNGHWVEGTEITPFLISKQVL